MTAEEMVQTRRIWTKEGQGFAHGGVILKQPDFSQMEKVEEVGVVMKPPEGIKPENLYKEQRLRDLASVIDRYIQGGFFGGQYATTIAKWCEELIRRLEEFK